MEVVADTGIIRVIRAQSSAPSQTARSVIGSCIKEPPKPFAVAAFAWPVAKAELLLPSRSTAGVGLQAGTC